ncbi:MAG: hypothetical protein IJA52_00330 [Clostridia bacterium]|nr:hypothetical protein [Clostridia bacterium]
MKLTNRIVISIILAFFYLMILSSCMKSINVPNIEETNVPDTEQTAVSFLEIDCLESDWDKSGFTVDLEEKQITIDKSSIDTFDNAVLIGEDISNQCENGSNSVEYKLTAVVHAKNVDTWVYNYTKIQYRKGTKDLINKHGFYIAVDNNCNIIRMWVEEW